MTAITMIQIDRTELRAMLDRAAANAIAAAAEASGELWSASDLARPTPPGQRPAPHMPATEMPAARQSPPPTT